MTTPTTTNKTTNLALLEYLYDGILPDDKFIRIVTTLMRNKIDREKAAYEKRNKDKEFTSVTETEQTVANNEIQITEQVVGNNNPSDLEPKSPLPKTNFTNANQNISEQDAKGIDEIIHQHYNPDDQSLQNFCKRKGCDIKDLADLAKQIMTKLVTDGSWHPAKLPDRSQESILWKIDKLVLDKIQSNIIPNDNTMSRSQK